MEILPSILAQSKLEFAMKVERVRPLGLRLHVDIMDGIFVPNQTWADPYEVEELTDGLNFNVHLMIESPEHAVPTWAVSRADRVYFHFESTYRHKLIIRAIKDSRKMGIVLNPRTPATEIGHLLDRISSVLVMSVTPGASGQEFMPEVLNKVKEIKQLRPKMHVAVDGGIKPHNIARVAQSGADAAIVGSALTDAPDPQMAYLDFIKHLKPSIA